MNQRAMKMKKSDFTACSKRWQECCVLKCQLLPGIVVGWREIHPTLWKYGSLPLLAVCDTEEDQPVFIRVTLYMMFVTRWAGRSLKVRVNTPEQQGHV